MSEYLIPVTVEPLDEGGYLATSPVLQGLLAQGRTISETLEIAEDVARKIIESCIEHGDHLPEKLTSVTDKRIKLEVQVPVPVEL
ncbi:MAG: type II toxin-antitoxin system HicB family antitoxin [Elusimicrobiota bacterium]